ncbi:hypothetical protein [Syntrophaceticus schinkii]|uniref:Uncharacterized protein n=1 Tax=Syntrophaceticus schinkii TaxID=499207 RepID=A0A0B7MFZ0_9FIRM|nr:hypothetical protein [Syntrophaceticus schinkii]MDD4264706.1 hypothetical protein [Bacillota bacterium]CEO88990.1 hypothetical protein SSCH_330007 [Syntrophaceticus schinkii]
MEATPKKNEQNALSREGLKTRRRMWTFVYAALLFLAYFLPYTVLKDVPKIYGTFLAWWVLMAAIILATFIVTSKWRD